MPKLFTLRDVPHFSSYCATTALRAYSSNHFAQDFHSFEVLQHVTVPVDFESTVSV